MVLKVSREVADSESLVGGRYGEGLRERKYAGPCCAECVEGQALDIVLRHGPVVMRGSL
jgi:hypothetical protein